MAEIIIHNHTIDKSIQQLHDTTNRHQTAINTIQATLQTQQKDITDIKTAIVDIRTSINHMIRSVFATKLGFEITLPSPLPIYPIPPTPLTTAATNSTAPAPSSPTAPAPPLASAAAAPPFHKPSFLNPPHPNSSASSISPPSFSYNDKDNNLLLVNGNKPPLTLTSNLTNNLPKLLPITYFSPTPLHSPTLCIIYQGVPGDYSEAVTSEANWKCKAYSISVGSKHKPRCEKKVLIFDPGGTFNIESIYDLEDKVDFKGSVMIRLYKCNYGYKTVVQPASC